MAHEHLRKEKDCLNCGTIVTGDYCPHCGQKNVEPKQSLGHMISHFFQDVTHFDGKFFETIKVLITKPGFLSEEYMKGRRAKYVDPVRMYLFLSFVLFFLMFSLPEPEGGAHTAKGHVLSHADSMQLKRTERIKDSLNNLKPMDTLARGFKVRAEGANIAFKTDQDFALNRFLNGIKDTTIAQYEANQKALPQSKRDGFFRRYFVKRFIGFDEYQHKHPETYWNDIGDIMLHSIPKMLFVSIPIFAFLLWLFYIRSRRNYYFVTHGIFTLHLYCAIFLLLILDLPFDYVDNHIANNIEAAIILLLPMFYLYKAMRRFYKQRRAKTILKFLLMMVSSFVVFIVLLLFFLVNTILSIGVSGH